MSAGGAYDEAGFFSDPGGHQQGVSSGMNRADLRPGAKEEYHAEVEC